MIVVTLSLASTTTAGGNSVAGKITLAAPAPAGGTTVTLTSSSLALAGLVSPTLGAGSAVRSLPVTIPQGASIAAFTVRTFGVATQSAVTLTASSSVGAASASLALTPATVKSIAISPLSVTGGQAATATITLDGHAPAAGGVILLSSGAASVGMPASTALRPDAAIASVSLTTSPVAATTSVPLSASINSSAAAIATIVVLPPVPSAVQLSPAGVFGGTPSSATIILNGTAAGGGRLLTLTASSASASLPVSVLVPAGTDRQTVPIATQAVSQSQSVIVTATTVREAASRTTVSDGSVRTISDGTSNTISTGESIGVGAASATLSLFPFPQLLSITAAPTTLTGGDSLLLSLTWSPPAGLIGGAAVPVAQAQLATNHPELVSIPASVALAPATGAPTFSAPTTVIVARTTPPTADQTASVTATLGTQAISASFVVRKPIPPLASFSVRPNATSGGNVVAQFTLDPAITNTVVVTLSTDHPDIVQLPATISLGQSAVPTPFTFTTSKPASRTVVTITASARGQTLTATVTANP
jgi:hypothetical protein